MPYKDPERKKAHHKAYRKTHKEELKAYNKCYYQANREKQKVWQKAYWEENKEKLSAYRKQWYRENREKRLAQEKTRYGENKDKFHLWNKEYYKTHSDAIKASSHKREAIKRGAAVQIVYISEIGRRDKWKCQLCKKKVNPKLEYPNRLSKTLDHIIPLSKHGTHEPKNVQLAHFVCNLRKHTKAVFDQLRIF